MNRLPAIILCLVATACSGRSPSPTCARLEAQVRDCDASLPADAYRSLREYCEGAVAYQPAAGEPPTNLAAAAKASLETCSAKPTCGETLACLDQRSCRFLLTAPDDPSPIFQCM